MAVDLLILLQDRGSQSRGDIIEIRGPEPAHPEINLRDSAGNYLFGVVRVSDANIAEIEGRNQPWKREIGYRVVNYNANIDTYRLAMFAKNVRGNKGVITRQMVEAFLTRWNASIVSAAENNIVFDIGVYNASISQAFHDRDVSQIVFTDLGYEQSTGVHSIRADYSAVQISATAIERHIIGKGGIINDHQSGIITYDIDRDTVIASFQREIAEKSDGVVERRRYHLSEDDIFTLEIAERFLVVSKAVFLVKVKDKVNN